MDSSPYRCPRRAAGFVAFGVALAGLASSSGCAGSVSPVEEAAFSLPAWESSVTEEGTTSRELMFISLRPVRSAEVDDYVNRNGVCPDGAPTQTLGPLSRDREPDANGVFFADTTFRFRIACESLPNEVSLPPNLTVADARRVVAAAAGESESERMTFREVAYDPQRGRFPAYHEALGELLTTFDRVRCGGEGVTFGNAAAGVPASAENGALPRMVIGVVLECAAKP